MLAALNQIVHDAQSQAVLFAVISVASFLIDYFEERRRGRAGTWERVFRRVSIAITIFSSAGFSNALSTIITKSPEFALETISNPLFTPLWLVIGVGLFWMRGYLPKTYGITEVMVGMTAIFYAINSTRLVTSDTSILVNISIPILTPKLLALASGIYIIVRGFDNFEKGLSSAAKVRWNTVFWKAPVI